MKQEKLRVLVRQELLPFMSRFEQDNRGNRISLEFIQGLGMILENFISEIVQKALKVQAGEQEVKPPSDITKKEVK